MILVKSDFVALKQGNGRDYPIPTKDLLLFHTLIEGAVYKWIMLLRQNDGSVNAKCRELCFCRLAVAKELNVVFKDEVLESTIEHGVPLETTAK